MPQQVMSTVENNFTGGLKTEFTALNFPENACTETDNCVFSIIGDVTRRSGIDYEDNHINTILDTTNRAISSYKWNNAGGDGETQLYCVQIGRYIYFFKTTAATQASPLSAQLLATTVDIHLFWVAGSPDPSLAECQFADGNGCLFVFHPSLEPVFCKYAADVVTATGINLQIRDTAGILEPGVSDTIRPGSLSIEHNYNLINQGWTNAALWQVVSSTLVTTGTGSQTYTVPAGQPIVVGDAVRIEGPALSGLGPYTATMSGLVTSYGGTTLVINVTSTNFVGGTGANWTILKSSGALITTWFGAVGNYPANSDVWWNFKNTSDVFAPATTYANTSLSQAPAPKGFFILSAFNQNRSNVASIAGLTTVSTVLRPRTGTWFQGRIWYTGVDASFPATGDAQHYSWTENIYFSQIVTDDSQIGKCYQTNDPTSQELFDLLPSDGGVIQIQGCGPVYKLFPVQNGMLVFAANGIWFITGNQGIGFSANDYTITKISAVQSIAGTSYINVLGYPTFWNEEGIYTVTPSPQGGGLVVNNMCLGTILSFYANIPLKSKKYVKGDYNPLTFVISWIYRNTDETDISDRYKYNRVLNLNTSNKAFYPYTINSTLPYIIDIKYIAGPGGSTSPDPVNKFLVSVGSRFTFAEEKDDTRWIDFYSEDLTGTNYTSYFVTGYKLHGRAIFKWQPIYTYMFSKADEETAYKIQGIWDYGSSGNSGRYSSIQLINNPLSDFGVLYRRHKIRGRGLSLQLKVISVNGKPFNIIGWSSSEAANTSI